ncbi:MAG TPA: amidohydrolase family protein, partial [Pseudonocardiaceae bacterium]
RDSGIRGIFLYGGQMDEARRIRDTYFPPGSGGRLAMGLALRGPHFATPEANQADFALARDLGLPISIHAGMAGFPAAVYELDKLGLLGPDVNYAHANEFAPREFELVADSGGSIAISPSVDMTMALGAYPATGQALAHGIPAGLAADTVASSGTDLFSEMRLALAAERSRAYADAVTPVPLDHRDMLHLATAGGARAWRLDDEIGTLTPGKRADIVVVDLRPPHLDGFGDPVLSLLVGAGSADVETVLVDGDVVKADGTLVGPIVDEARHQMRSSRQRLSGP